MNIQVEERDARVVFVGTRKAMCWIVLTVVKKERRSDGILFFDDKRGNFPNINGSTIGLLPLLTAGRSPPKYEG